MSRFCPKSHLQLVDKETFLPLLSHYSMTENYNVHHSALMSNQTKVRKTKTGPFQGDKAWSGDHKSALFEILQNREHFYQF